MKALLFFLTTYSRILTLINKNKAARFAFKLFQKTQPKKLTLSETRFYDNTPNFQISTELENAIIFEKGAENDELVFLVHGWNSNAGSMGAIADALVDKGYHCILVDLPGHGSSSLNYSNLKINKEFFQAVLKRIHGDKPINIVAHSFGTLVSSYALSEMDIKVNNLIYLSPPNELAELFLVLKESLSLNNEVYEEVIRMAENLLNEKVDDISVSKKSKKVDYQQLTIMHDRYDKILPLSYSQLLADNMDNSKLHIYEKIGHTRMLWNEELIKDLAASMHKITSPASIKEVPVLS